MENLEEVLQVLDEFQKMRPSEIPRELEEYLCWVAKTGDPVYQWSLIKTLFREKLTRVMTDFYESCPSLELAPCPNVDHFNYDTMKSNLLERLESFANAPFTVQRICELLTAPRKEYNRVDKFMRAIEKNILVVSTREPGPIARRNENGDGMVNGSVDEETTVTQPSQDVEMEYWEKDCPSTVTISVHTVENDAPLLHAVMPTTTVVKNVFGAEEASHEKAESTHSKSGITGSSFSGSATLEFSGVPNLTSQAQSQDSQMGPTIQNLTTIVPEASGIVGDVPEAIMNEDTSSQPSLDLENEEGEVVDPTRKLQTTFQTKDFGISESKSSKFYVDNSKVIEKEDVVAAPVHVQEEPIKINDILRKSDIEPKAPLNDKESESPVVESFPSSSKDDLEDTTKSDTEVDSIQTIDTPDVNIEEKEVPPLENSDAESIPSASNLDKSAETLLSSAGNTSSEETASANTSEDVSLDVESLKDQGRATELAEDLKPIVEEPCSKDNIAEDFGDEKDNLTITEVAADETIRAIKSVVPDPIPIIEEPKDAEAVNVRAEDNSSPVEISEEPENQNPTVVLQPESEDKMTVESSDITQLQGVTIAVPKVEDNDTVMDNAANKKEEQGVELMDVDDEESLSVFQQDDEPMEQEAAPTPQS